MLAWAADVESPIAPECASAAEPRTRHAGNLVEILAGRDELLDRL
jgi:hypothetical protein